MKLLRVISSMDPATGGPCQGIRNLAPALEKLGCQNDVVCFDDPNQTFVKEESFTIHGLGAARGPWARNPALPMWLRQHLPGYDAVIIHGLWQYPAYVTSREVAKRRKQHSPSPKLFVMPHGMLDPWFQKDPTRRLKAWRNSLYWKLLEHRTISLADGLLFTTQNELELARQPFRPYRPRKEWNAGYGVAAPPQKTAAMEVALANACPELNGRKYFLYLSRIHPKKGVDLLVEQFGRVVQERLARNESAPALVIAGPLDSDFAKEIQRRAQAAMNRFNKEHLAPELQILFPGMLTGDAKWGAFYGCQAFLLPSHQENFGIAVAEALACGKPVLISDQVNIYNEIQNGRAGWICKDTAEGVYDALNQMMGSKMDHLQIAGERARATYEEHYLPEAAAHRLMVILNS